MLFSGVGDAVEQKLEELWAEPVTEQQKIDGEALMAKSEQNRITAMKDYVAQKALKG